MNEYMALTVASLTKKWKVKNNFNLCFELFTGNNIILIMFLEVCQLKILISFKTVIIEKNFVRNRYILL